MTSQAEVIRALREFTHGEVFRGWRKMLTGRRTATNTITLAGAPAGKTWVRAHDASREQTAVWGFVGIPNVTVYVAPGVDGENRIMAIDYAESVQSHGNKVVLAQQPPLDGNLNTVIVAGRNFLPGRVRPYAATGSMLVYVEPFAHHEGYYAGGTIDLTGDIPATAGTCAWVAVALDPATNTLYSYAGSDNYDAPTNLDEADAHAITVTNGYIPLAAVALEEGMTEITSATRIIDLRPHFYMRGGLVRDLDDLANVNTTGKADGDVLVWDAGASEWVPATPSLSTIDNIGDVDTSSTQPTDGQALIWNDSTNLWVPGSAGGGGGGGAAAFGAGVTKTLSSDVAAAGTDRHLILAAESGTADDCIEITGLSNGDEVIVRADAGDTITLKHNAAGATDKILLYAGADFALSGDKTMKLVKTASGKVVQYVDDYSGNSVFINSSAAPPASPVNGDVWFPSDGVGAAFGRSGAAWHSFGPVFPLVPVNNAAFSWQNQGTATLTETAGGVYLHAPALSGDNYRIRVKTAPSTPYTISMMNIPQAPNVTGPVWGMCFRENSSGKLHLLIINGASLVMSTKMNSPTSFSAHYTTLQLRAAPPFLHIADDGTSRKLGYSYDGVNVYYFHTVARTDFITADQVGFVVQPNHATIPAGMQVLSWREG